MKAMAGMALAAALNAAAATADGPWFVVNEDNDHFFKCDASLMNRKGLEDYADYICRGKVTHVFFCVAGQRTSYASKTWEPIWTGLGDPARPDTATAADGTRDRWAVNAKALFDAGVDPYSVWIARCREKGVSPWVSLRMNDVHWCEVTNYFRNSTFYKTHPEWRLDPSGTNASWFLNQLDYARREVRDYHLAQIREIAARWPADGVELDWMRFGHVFRLGEERANAHLLDAFMREAAGAIRASGKRVAVRVPYDPDLCAEYGFNVLFWAQEGLVDVVIPAPFVMTAPGLPVARWRRCLEGTRVRMVPDLGCEVPAADKAAVPELYRGVAKRFYEQGAEGVYLYNLPYKSNARYSTDSGGCAYAPVDIAAELYANGMSPADIADRPCACPHAPPDWPYPEMRHVRVADVVPAGRDGAALQAAVDRAHAAGGGRVVLTNGIYESATLYLKSNVELHIAEGAVLRGDGRADAYDDVSHPLLGNKRPEKSAKAFLVGLCCTNIAVTGRGTVDGNALGMFGELTDDGAYFKKTPWPRPRLMELVGCRGVRISDVTLTNSANWTCWWRLCDDVVAERVRIGGDPPIINNDGFHVDACRRVTIRGCDINTRDDAVVMRAIRCPDGAAGLCEDVTVEDCRLRSRNNCIRLGCPSDGTIRRGIFRRLAMHGFNGVLSVHPVRYLQEGDHGRCRMEDLLVEDCDIDVRNAPIVYDVEPGVCLRAFGNTTFRNVRCRGAAPVLHGTADSPLVGMKMENVAVESNDGVRAEPAVNAGDGWERIR